MLQTLSSALGSVILILSFAISVFVKSFLIISKRGE